VRRWIVRRPPVTEILIAFAVGLLAGIAIGGLLMWLISQ
jgi:hypothetical protein